jgi:hypothetical protein
VAAALGDGSPQLVDLDAVEVPGLQHPATRTGEEVQISAVVPLSGRNSLKPPRLNIGGQRMADLKGFGRVVKPIPQGLARRVDVVEIIDADQGRPVLRICLRFVRKPDDPAVSVQAGQAPSRRVLHGMQQNVTAGLRRRDPGGKLKQRVSQHHQACGGGGKVLQTFQQGGARAPVRIHVHEVQVQDAAEGLADKTNQTGFRRLDPQHHPGDAQIHQMVDQPVDDGSSVHRNHRGGRAAENHFQGCRRRSRRQNDRCSCGKVHDGAKVRTQTDRTCASVFPSVTCRPACMRIRLPQRRL